MFAALEDSSVALSAVKASCATEFFAADIARWERTLASVSETLEAVLQVLHASSSRLKSCAECLSSAQAAPMPWTTGSGEQ